MWIVRASVEGDWRELSVRTANELPSPEHARGAVRKVAGSEPLLRYIDNELKNTREDSGVVRSFDAVQRWSAKVVDEAEELSEVRGRFVSLSDVDGALGYFGAAPSGAATQPDTVVSHAHSFV